ncbi:glutamyl aminopeptidase-like [Venturia canescens]|uniref:glutamyl aminopeptidase-like n=1 Tax=Venturia canescens TaxID=32260 RepID=UPI001C9CB92A|nr:glutamyl aminopeptidase-like [Venturia canescens]
MRYIFVLLLWTVSIDSLDHAVFKRLNELSDPITRNDTPPEPGSRLSKNVLPRKYVIAVCPDLQRNTFRGAIQITCEFLEARKYVALHAKDLNIESTSFAPGEKPDSSRSYTLESVHPLPELEMIILNFRTIVKPGIYTMRMNFSGTMDNQINGFYLSTYKYSNGNATRRKLAVTQFEPTYARKAFPCFDEPGFKAIFQVKIIHSSSKGYHAMSNMPSLPKNNNNFTITCFATSLPMSTYLVAFLVSDFTCTTSIVNSLTGTTIPISVCSSVSNKPKLRFALSVAMRALTFYMNFFQIDYPLPKIDLVGVPDFAAGAMENWGLVTFRETEILQCDQHSSVGNTKSVALTIAHELAHMWFGNLVTLVWWNDLWLNEGFATYMEHVAVHSIFPEWQQMDSFPLETKYLTMRSDSKVTAHPIVRCTENADEIGQMFDHISYQKGAAVLKMLEDVMGNERFVSGIREYLLKYKFGNAATFHLLEILQKHFDSKVNLVDFMKRWTELPGFPVLSIHRYSQTNYKLFQKRFVARGESTGNSTWDLPIRYVTSRMHDGAQLAWFLGNASCAELSLRNPVDWIKLNHESIGYYIVNYSEDLWSSFGKLLSEDLNILSPSDRADLLHDSFILADSGNLAYDSALNLTKYLRNETVFQPWVVAASWLLRVDRLLGGTRVHRRFRCYARHLVGKVYRDVGWTSYENEDFNTRELRIVALRVACSIGHKHCLQNGEKMLKVFIQSNGTERPPADLRSIVYSFGLVRLGPDHLESYEKMWRIFLRENDPQEKERLLIGLADVRDPNIILKYLERVSDENLVRRQNFFEAIGKVASNQAGLTIIWNFLRNNWDSLVKKYTLNDAAMGSLVGKIVSSFKDRTRFDEAKEFFNKYPDAGAGANSRKLALEESASNMEWIDRNPAIINLWLEKNKIRRITKVTASP